jgi:DNA-binding transcriptional MerR regulator
MFEEDGMSASYKIHEFAELAGVTVKALHHYDRLGLLKPRRTDAGYRIYAGRDLERLEQIVALKFLGLPLKQIGAVLDRADVGLPEALRMQRHVLEEKQRLLARALSAITDAEKALRPGEPTDPAVLKRLIETIDIQDQLDKIDFKQYFSEDALAKFRQFYERGIPEEWKELQRNVVAALAEDPAGETAQALAIRWRELMQRDACLLGFLYDPEVQAGFKRGGADVKNWPPALLRRFEESGVGEMTQFMRKAMAALPKKS